MTEQELTEARKKLRDAHWQARKNRLLSTGEIMDLNVKLRDDLNRLQGEYDRQDVPLTRQL
jgi:hypothetical protein